MADVKKPTAQAFRAFVDASAGAMGALFAAVLLYPLDVVKTRQQVAVDERAPASTSESTSPSPNGADTKEELAVQLQKRKQRNILVTCWLLYRSEGIEGLFAGLSSKVVYTLISNFAYFYWYSILKQAAEKRTGKAITTGMNLLIGSAAGALNMTMTLPLEMINTRAQIQPSDDEESDEDDTVTVNKPSKASSMHHKGMWELVKEIYAEDGLLSFWKGFIPSLVLVSNPSINFTVFDKLKLRLQQSKMAASQATRLSALTAWEAFVLAAIAKAIATIITYPVIRAKVLMQAQKKQLTVSSEAKDGQHHHHHHHSPEMGTSMVQVLKRIGEVEGPAGYFKGCSAQLFNTVLKSALLVMTKEQITKYTMRILYALRRDAAPKAAAIAAKA